MNNNIKKIETLLTSSLFSVLAICCRAPSLSTGPDRMNTVPSGNSGEGSKYQCKNVTGSTDPWLVEWDPSAKVRLQSKSKKGVLLVKYTGCELEVLYGCEQEEKYEFTPTTRSRQTEYINNEDELFAKLPIGALNLAAEFNQGDRWSLDYVLVGMQETTVAKVNRTNLSGRCVQATHFVKGMAVGAYQLGSAAHSKGGAEVTLYGAGAGGSSGGEAGLLRQDGRYTECVKKETEAEDSDCQAIVRLYLKPVSGTVPKTEVMCPDGTEYRNGKCIQSNVITETKNNCPDGTVLKDDRCVKTEIVKETTALASSTRKELLAKAAAEKILKEVGNDILMCYHPSQSFSGLRVEQSSTRDGFGMSRGVIKMKGTWGEYSMMVELLYDADTNRIKVTVLNENTHFLANQECQLLNWTDLNKINAASNKAVPDHHKNPIQ